MVIVVQWRLIVTMVVGSILTRGYGLLSFLALAPTRIKASHYTLHSLNISNSKGIYRAWSM